LQATFSPAFPRKAIASAGVVKDLLVSSLRQCGMIAVMNSLRVAAFQRQSIFDDVTGIVRRLSEDLTWCDDQGVQLAVFPECYLQGYAVDRPTIARRALALNGAQIAAVLATLAPFRTAFVLGVVEQRGSDFYNTAAVIQGGVLLGAYAKSHPNEPGFDAGKDFPVFSTAGWRFGVNICNDANFADPALQISRQGARLICYPLNNMLPPATAAKWRNKSLANLQDRAIETGCWVVSSDIVGEHNGLVSHGCTCVIASDGRITGRAAEGREESITFDLSCAR
jgi:predicted amidohydrolase